MMSHWSVNYIGLKFRPGGRDKSGVDCFGLLKMFYAEHFGIDVPDVGDLSAMGAVECHNTLSAREGDWERIDEPTEGAAVAMGRSRMAFHVGIWTEADGGKVVHCFGRQNVVADSLKTLRFKGFDFVAFYRNKLWRSSQS